MTTPSEGGHVPHNVISSGAGLAERIADFYERSRRVQALPEREYDSRVLPGKLKELAERYDIRMRDGEMIPLDLAMARRAFEAGRALLLDVGCYCMDTEGTMSVSADEVEAALAAAPLAHTYGCGGEAVECVGRGVEDVRRPLVKGGPNGCPLTEEHFIPIMTSVAQEEVDGVHTGSLQSVLGIPNRAHTPIEILACKKEALWAREATSAAGKPGLSILGIMSGVTSEAQDAGDFEGGLRPTDPHLVVFLNELKFDYDLLKKVLHDAYLGCAIDANVGGPLHGGYAGGPETAAIVGIAEALLGFVMCRPSNFSWYPQSLFTGATTSRESLWTAGMLLLAFRASGHEVILDTYVGPQAGPWTEMVCRETAAQAVANTACGASALYGSCGARMVKTDHVTGMEARMLVEASRAAAGMSLADANDVLSRLVPTYGEALKAGAAPSGRPFQECYDVETLRPQDEYVALWEREKTELRTLGLHI
jgi:methylamine--corrinoid protein Co-methyltransferase